MLCTGFNGVELGLTVQILVNVVCSCLHSIPHSSIGIGV